MICKHVVLPTFRGGSSKIRTTSSKIVTSARNRRKIKEETEDVAAVFGGTLSIGTGGGLQKKGHRVRTLEWRRKFLTDFKSEISPQFFSSGSDCSSRRARSPRRPQLCHAVCQILSTFGDICIKSNVQQINISLSWSDVQIRRQWWLTCTCVCH